MVSVVTCALKHSHPQHDTFAAERQHMLRGRMHPQLRTFKGAPRAIRQASQRAAGPAATQRAARARLLPP